MSLDPLPDRLRRLKAAPHQEQFFQNRHGFHNGKPQVRLLDEDTAAGTENTEQVGDGLPGIAEMVKASTT